MSRDKLLSWEAMVNRAISHMAAGTAIELQDATDLVDLLGDLRRELHDAWVDAVNAEARGA